MSLRGKLGKFSRLWPLILPLLLLLPGIASFPYPSSQASSSDLSLTHYPYAVYLRESILSNHHFPLWSPLWFSGSPFAANPLSGLWYPPGWLALLFPLPLGFNIMIYFHLLWGGVGLYCLLRDEGLDHYPALFGGMAFIALPKLFAHYGAGHLTLLYAIPWTPWLLFVSRQFRDSEPTAPRWIGGFPSEALVLALIFLADPRWAFYSGVLWVAYSLFCIPNRCSFFSIPNLVQRFGRLMFQGFLTILLAAPLLLPMLEFASLSSRSTMSTVDQVIFSLPAGRLLGLIIPDYSGFHEYMLYAGQAVILLSFAALISLNNQQKKPLFWFVVWVAAVAFAMSGSISPLKETISLPLLNLLRVPSRSLFLAGLALAVMSAHGLQVLINDPYQLRSRRFGLILAGYACFVTAFAIGIRVMGLSSSPRFFWAAILALISAIWIGIAVGGKISLRLWVAVFFLIALVDWWMIDRSLFSPRPASQVLSERHDLAEQLACLENKEGLFRIYSPSYSIPQQTAVELSLQLADGVDPLHLLSYAEFMERATGIPSTGYSVTIPPFRDGDPALATSSYLPNPELLGLLNVRYITSEFDLVVDGLVLERKHEGARLYRNTFARPRAWLQLDDNRTGLKIRNIENLNWSPEHIEFNAQGPGLAVLSEVVYPGWLVRVDGRPVELLTYQGLFRSVQIGSGSHKVSFDFRPRSVYLGMITGAIGWIILGLTWFFSLRRKP